MDNRVFNVNGSSRDMLTRTIELVFEQRGHGTNATCDGWMFDNEKGLILLWWVSDSNDNANRFPVSLDAKATSEMVWQWLRSDESDKVKLSGWDVDMDHDGHNTMGWRVFVEDWGHVGNEHGALCAVTPAHMWHGK